MPQGAKARTHCPQLWAIFRVKFPSSRGVNDARRPLESNLRWKACTDSSESGKDSVRADVRLAENVANPCEDKRLGKSIMVGHYLPYVVSAAV